MQATYFVSILFAVAALASLQALPLGNDVNDHTSTSQFDIFTASSTPDMQLTTTTEDTNAPKFFGVVGNGTVLQVGTPVIVGLALIGLGLASLIGGAISNAIAANGGSISIPGLPELYIPTLPPLPHTLRRRAVSDWLSEDEEDVWDKIMQNEKFRNISDLARNASKADCQKRIFCEMHTKSSEYPTIGKVADRIYSILKLINTDRFYDENSVVRFFIENFKEGSKAAKAGKNCEELFSTCQISLDSIAKNIRNG
jgi:hypothetical protein